MARTDLYSDHHLIDFLGLIKHEELQHKYLMVLGRHSSEKRVPVDFFPWDKEKMAFCLQSDFSSVFSSGGLFGFGKKAKTSPALLEGLLSAKKELGFGFESQWSHEIAHIATALDWNEKLGLLACGNDSGALQLIRPSAENRLKFEVVSEFKLHSDRIVKVVIDQDKKLVYSVSNDRRFKVFNIDKKSLTVGKSPLSKNSR